MLITHNREKLLQVITFFSQNVEKLGKIKLFKLLYFLDFEHYKQVGRSVTGLDYSAWKMGPVPVDLHEEIKQPEADFLAKIKIEQIPIRKGRQEMLKFNALSEFDQTHFSKRELKILNTLAQQYKNAFADDMIEATHLERLPWHQIYEVEGKKKEIIPYELALPSQNRESMHKDSIERLALLEVLK
ncbi:MULTISPECIES: Panacea domain-containing protein [Rodentibacter]|uniref:DUF4065 domain-containing protein n=1 Tax=Rodentibacter pneumotropicus TaxID=758 RepID=A0A4V6RIC8_9PAST|nr:MULTISPECIES: Panacea domain-containing protein [Pasteurellaceae]AOF53671.1 hypothetical protein AC062_1579 [Pasteurellaceae bacterium NI1060]AOF54478.1 hypothetical protein AC062_2392 [Pasteurellaceae bacterium NI1060]MCQ9121618.1 SocA family protein [Rodentibacter pneumotropicus]MCQ9122744.1 SocA family protein [Rodentibacter heylii]OOF70832.1 hypothetical protein BKG91_11825 [Rodentibacter heylii]